MTPELTYLTYAILLLIAHMFIQATASDLSKGIGWAAPDRRMKSASPAPSRAASNAPSPTTSTTCPHISHLP